jgi:hypothetical protein
MYVAQMNIPVLNVDPTPIVIPMDPFFSENTGGWIAYSNNEIVNVYDGALSLKLTMHGFNTSLGNNNDLSYILEKWDGSSWAEVKRVSRTKSAPGDYADMFGGYFQLLYNQKFRVLAVSGTGGIQLTQGTALEIQVLA